MLVRAEIFQVSKKYIKRTPSRTAYLQKLIWHMLQFYFRPLKIIKYSTSVFYSLTCKIIYVNDTEST